jgi:hypothetical protein
VIIFSDKTTSPLLEIQKGLRIINNEGFIKTTPPSLKEKDRIRTAIKYSNSNLSFFDFAQMIFEEIGVLPIFRENLLDALKKVTGEDFDKENVKEIAEYLYKKMHRGME